MVAGSVYSQASTEVGTKELEVAMHTARTDEVVWGVVERIKEGIEDCTDGYKQKAAA